MSKIDYEAESDKRLNWMDLTGGPAQGGMTMLDYFAAAALQGLLASPRLPADGEAAGVTDESIAKLAYYTAEAMLAERNKRFTPTNTVRGVTGKTYG